MIAFAAIAALALSLLLGLQIGRSGASYTSNSKNPGSVFTAGTMVLTNSKASTAVVTATKLIPGGPSTAGTLSISVTGNCTSVVTLTGTGDGNALAGAVTLQIEDVTGTATTLWTGKFADLQSVSGGVSLGSFTPGTTKNFRFTVAFPAANGAAALQNLSTTETLTFTGVTQ